MLVVASGLSNLDGFTTSSSCSIHFLFFKIIINFPQTTDDSWNLNVSAGELLGRTHEELVLLLIQLRRQSASICKEMESCHIEIEAQVGK